MQRKLHPIQPKEIDEQGVLRFKANEMVRFLLDNGPFTLNDLVVKEFTKDDWLQFLQLIGYSDSGIHDYNLTRQQHDRLDHEVYENLPDDKTKRSKKCPTSSPSRQR